jgi:hypothetical protein
MRAALLASLLVASCTFPDVQFGDASVPVDSGSDVVTTNDAGSDAVGDEPDPCDMDHDGYKAMGTCGGNDCNDNDPRANPGVKNYVYDEPDAAPFGDWNCDGKVDMQYKAAACAATTCNSEGYANTQGSGCGITNPYVTCTGTLCAAVDAGTRTQGCL